MSNYSKADTKTQWFQDNFPGAELTLKPETMVVVLHTTEGIAWPTYQGGATAPNYTGLPPIGLRKGKWRAHFPDERSSRALVNAPGGVQTNTLNAIQVELIGTCDPKHSRSWNGEGRYIAGRDYVYWPNANNRQKKWVARLLTDLHNRHGLRLKAPKRFLPYPGSYGRQNPNRMSFNEWSNATGVVGHQHVPENSHGDPGNLDVGFILKKAEKFSQPKVVLTRGKNVDHALDDLLKSKGRGDRKKLIDAAVRKLKKIPTFKK